MTSQSFGALGVPANLAAVLEARNITIPTPIQAATLPDSLQGRDVLGRGRTGSGKSYAFLLPIVARLAESGTRRAPKRPRALILAPTRELAIQLDEALAPLAAAAGLTSRTVFGGVNQRPQVAALTKGVDVVVACPGRLEDLIAQGHVTLDAIEITVLDEADHMADLGFLPSVRRLLSATPSKGQRMLFSATLDKAVDTLVKQFLHQPKVHEADSADSPVPTLRHHVLHVATEQHLPVLVNLAAAPGRSVVFTRTKHRAKKLAKQLNAAGVPAVELQGNMSQSARERSMAAFHSGEAQTLVATDVAARGIHVDDVGLVIHADPPVEHKAYTHRSGRTARAGAEGTVVTLMLDAQRGDVQTLTRKAGVKPKITRADERHPVLAEIAPGEREFPGGIMKAALQQQQPSRRNGRGQRPTGESRSLSRTAARNERPVRSKGQQDSRSASPSAASFDTSDRSSRTHRATRGARGSANGGQGGAAAFSATGGGRRRGR